MPENADTAAEYRCPGTDVRIAIFHPDDHCYVCGYIKEAHNEANAKVSQYNRSW